MLSPAEEGLYEVMKRRRRRYLRNLARKWRNLRKRRREYVISKKAVATIATIAISGGVNFTGC